MLNYYPQKNVNSDCCMLSGRAVFRVPFIPFLPILCSVGLQHDQFMRELNAVVSGAAMCKYSSAPGSADS